MNLRQFELCVWTTNTGKHKGEITCMIRKGRTGFTFGKQSQYFKTPAELIEYISKILPELLTWANIQV